MKKIFLLSLCLLCISYAYCQKNKGVELEKLKTTYSMDKNHNNAIAYMTALENAGHQEAEINVVLDTLFSMIPSEKYTSKSWYFFDRYVTDLNSPLMKNLLLDKYWANRLWASEKINHKITSLVMKLTDELYQTEEIKYSNQELDNYIIALNSFDFSEYRHLELCAYLIKLKVERNYSYAISTLQFATPEYADTEWVKTLDKMMINCAKLSKNSQQDTKRVEEYLERKAIDHFIAADKYTQLVKSVNQK